jgi:catechol 2,3-dioxygenase-like lactoylglutathione lyase family enzyme
MLSIGTVVIGVTDMRRAVEFWSEALGYVAIEDRAGPTWTVLEPATGTGTALALDLSESPVQEHPRMHLDLTTTDATEQEAEVDRLVSLGAVRVDWDLYPDDPDFVVLADPEGNRFCIIDLSHVDLSVVDLSVVDLGHG